MAAPTEMDCCGIYAIHYKGSVIYVGQSVLMSRRQKQHLRALELRNHRNFVLQRIYDKHPDALTFSVLERISHREELAQAEQRWMDVLEPIANLSKANGSHPHTEAARAKMRAYTRTAEHRQRLSEAMKGRVPSNKGQVGTFRHSDEARARIAAALKSRPPLTEEQLKRRSEINKGRVFTEEHRRKLAAAKLGKPQAESGRLALVGRKLSPEHRANISKSLRRRHGSDQQD